jgi:hypothetical protein
VLTVGCSTYTTWCAWTSTETTPLGDTDMHSAVVQVAFGPDNTLSFTTRPGGVFDEHGRRHDPRPSRPTASLAPSGHAVDTPLSVSAYGMGVLPPSLQATPATLSSRWRSLRKRARRRVEHRQHDAGGRAKIFNLMAASVVALSTRRRSALRDSVDEYVHAPGGRRPSDHCGLHPMREGLVKAFSWWIAGDQLG